MKKVIKNSLVSAIEKITKEKNKAVIAIDGKCGAGKSTLAQWLQEVFAHNCSTIHMDDFYLPLSLRTEERLNEPGGNIHYERFRKEVLPYLHGKQGFSYGVFDCSIMDIKGQVLIKPSSIMIVEGSYSLREEFRQYYDYRIFLDISEEEQRKRLIIRNGITRFEDFEKKWIPMENYYFDKLSVKECCDMIINNS